MQYNSGYTLGMKTAISIPDDIFRAAEELAGSRGLKRSELYRLALQEYLKNHSDRAITDDLNNFFATMAVPSDPVVKAARRRSMLKIAWEA